MDVHVIISLGTIAGPIEETFSLASTLIHLIRNEKEELLVNLRNQSDWGEL